MIQSKVKATYGDARTGFKEAKIRIEIATATTTQRDVRYDVEHFAIIDEETGAKTLIANSSKTMSIDEYNQYSQAVTTLIDNRETMTDFEYEMARLKVGLLAFIQSNLLKDDNGNSTGKTVWGLNPEDWEITTL
jgi:hypothetical protein